MADTIIIQPGTIEPDVISITPGVEEVHTITIAVPDEPVTTIEIVENNSTITLVSVGVPGATGMQGPQGEPASLSISVALAIALG